MKIFFNYFVNEKCIHLKNSYIKLKLLLKIKAICPRYQRYKLIQKYAVLFFRRIWINVLYQLIN